jgi:hypothetical protein
LEKIGEAQTGMAGGNFEFWIGRGLRAGLRRFMAESKRNAEAAEVAERSAEADRLGNHWGLPPNWLAAPAYFPYSASVSASSVPPRFDSIRLEEGKRKGEHPTSNIQHPTSNIQHPTSNIQHPTSNIER